jgi:hypothetical protein
MNVFRLVLFLAGLAAYLVAKQWLQPGVPPSSPAESSPAAAPHAEVLKPEQGLVQARK